jgi:E3 ubiquitin-protein ligase HECTD3
LDDVEEFDDGIITELREILDTTEEDFEGKFGDRYFTTTLSDLSAIELEEGGGSRALTFQDRAEYARKTLYERMKECELQCEAIKRGICQIIPEALLNMVSYKELEEWIYGKKTIDVELLRRHTEYSKGYGIERKEI